jgi:hypothetical protein
MGLEKSWKGSIYQTRKESILSSMQIIPVLWIIGMGDFLL